MIRQTSIEAYNKLKATGVLSPRRWAIYDWLFQNGPATANEIFQGIFHSSKITNANICARLNELNHMQLVREVRERACRVTGQNVIEWEVTDRSEPLPIPKGQRYFSFDAGYRKALLDVEGEVLRRMTTPSLDPEHLGYGARVIVESITKKLREAHDE